MPIQWTPSNGSSNTFGVSYTVSIIDARACDFWFYVPAGHATANIIFGYWDTSNVKRYGSINENKATGWTKAFS